MLTLIKKDIQVQKLLILILFFFDSFMFLLLQKDLSQSSFIDVVLSQVFLFVLISNQYEEKKKSYIMVNSLPLKRAEIMAAKYLSTLLIAITPVLFIYLCGLILNIFPLPFPVRILSLQSVFTILINAVIIMSLYFPLYYCFMNSLLSIGLFLIVYIFFIKLKMDFMYQESSWAKKLMLLLNSCNEWLAGFLILIVIATFILLSWRFSLYFYQKKDL